LSSWRREAPEGFEFTVKAWMLITHGYNARLWRRLRREVKGDPGNYGGFKPTREVMEAWEETLRAARSLDASIIVFQTPGSFKPEKENMRNLEAFMESIDAKGYTLAWEPRGEWWDKPGLLRELAEKLDIAIVGDPLMGKAPICNRGLCYYRLHGIGGRETNYKYKYTDEDLSRLYREISKLGSQENYILFNNIHAFDDALRFKNLVESQKSIH
ncbi:MAG: DUF72 domain-containing protein, partial [Desulfurococcales archaeon]|nr:DUF72 domain-containing protein [Desulfurococcales archaeon]